MAEHARAQYEIKRGEVHFNRWGRIHAARELAAKRCRQDNSHSCTARKKLKRHHEDEIHKKENEAVRNTGWCYAAIPANETKSAHAAASGQHYWFDRESTYQCVNRVLVAPVGGSKVSALVIQNGDTDYALASGCVDAAYLRMRQMLDSGASDEQLRNSVALYLDAQQLRCNALKRQEAA